MRAWWQRWTKGDGLQVAANVGWLYADQILRAVVGLVVFSMVTRSLGPAEFGVLSYAIAFPAIFIPLAGLGLDHVIIRDFVRHPEQRERIFGTAFALKTVTALLACGGALLAIRLVPLNEPARNLLFVTSLSLLLQAVLTLDYYFQSQMVTKYSALARIATGLLGNGVRAWLAWHGAPVAMFVWVFLAEAALYGVGLVGVARGTGLPWIRPWHNFDGGILRRLLGAAWPLFLADVAISGYLKFDQILLSQLAGPAVLGRYAAAFRLADYAEFFVLAVINAYFPKIVAIQQQRPTELMENMRKFFAGMTWFAVAIAVAVTLVARLLPGNEQLAAAGAFIGHCYPIWLRFRGGKGVATLMGIVLALHWPLALVYAIVWIGLLALLRFSSLAGMLAAVSAPVAASMLDVFDLVLLLLALALLVLWTHRANIGRLLDGTEPRVGRTRG